MIEDYFRGYRFLTFDISVLSTGWCKWDGEVLTYGTFGLSEKTDLGRRMEFRQRVIELIDGEQFDFIGVEDVIMGCNFDTTRALIQLNPIVDDLVYLGVVPNSEVQRIGNTEWKKYLREVSGYSGIVAGFGKEDIVKALNSLGFQTDEAQDVYDAVGVSLGVIMRKRGCKIQQKHSKLKTDLTKSYIFMEYSEDRVLSLKADGFDVCEVEFGGYRDMPHQFRDVVEAVGDDKIFILDAPRDKYGTLALTNKLVFNGVNNKMIAYKRGLLKGSSKK